MKRNVDIDTSTDALRALADRFDEVAWDNDDAVAAHEVYTAIPVTILAVAAERDRLVAERDEARADAARLRETSLDLLAHLTAAISLLERGDKKGAPSDMMFDIMLNDYRATTERARAALTPPAQETRHD